MGKTIFDKIWDGHVVKSVDDGPDVLFIDKHFIHEVTSPQAFDGLKKRGLKLFSPDRIVATADHNVPTLNQHLPIKDALSRTQVQKLVDNCAEHNIELYGLNHPYQGIVHVIGPELGITQPGMTIVCGDSHTSTHGAFGSVAFGIGTSEVEQVFATQCILQPKPKSMKITVNGELAPNVQAKDVILYIIAQLSTSGGTGYFVEYAGSVFESMSMEERMTVCNMSIEMGARGGLIAPDDITYNYLRGREFAPKGEEFQKKVAEWKALVSDDDAIFDKEYNFDASEIGPRITFGTNPAMGVNVDSTIPTLDEIKHSEQKSFSKSLEYMGLNAGQSLEGFPINYVFIGSCTNARIEDLRAAASLINGHKKADNVFAFIVPGSKQVEKQAVEEGLDKIFKEAGFELRQPGCSACLGMNEDKVPRGEYCVSTSNRNFEGRQGPGSRTILASPLTAVASAITGMITDVRKFK